MSTAARKKVFIRGQNVLAAARERIAAVFDDFEHINVSISGGKDSTVLVHLVGAEAQRRGRQIKVLFVDEEVDYQHTIEQVEYILFEMYPGVIEPQWLQVPFCLTNATSLTEGQLVAWEPGKEDRWMRPKDRRAIHEWPYSGKVTVGNKLKGFGFFDVLENYEANQQNCCFFIGLRADESMHRWTAVTERPRHKDWLWTSFCRGKGNIKAYPLYDWQFSDVWKYLHEQKVRYNKIYDWMWRRGFSEQDIRVSSLIHEKSFKIISSLPEFEPETYNQLTKRITGIATAHLYAKAGQLLKCTKLPKAYKTWNEYRDFLLQTYPDKGKKHIFQQRFARQPHDEFTARQQCKQIMLNDYENNLPVEKPQRKRGDAKKKWMELL